MKIAHIFQSGGIRLSEPGAAQLHIYYTMRGLQRAGHHVVLLAPYENRAVLFTEDIKIFGNPHSLSKNPLGKLGWSGNAGFKLFESGIRRFQKETKIPYLGLFDSYRMYDACCQNIQGYDLIHERYNLLAIGGALASRQLGIPMVLEVNADLIAQRMYKGKPERGLRKRFAIWATRFCFETAAKIICISEDLKDHLVQKWGVKESKLAVLPCAVDVDSFGNGYNPILIREKYGFKKEPIIMWVGGFYQWHDLGLLVDSFAGILQSHSKAKLVLVGDGMTRPAVENQVRDKGLENNVILTGRIDHTQIPEILSIADVAVVPSVPASAEDGGTGTPLKLYEYMAAGKPVVATDVNHNTSIIQHGYNGLLVKPGDVGEFGKAVENLLIDPAIRDHLGQNARRTAIDRYSWENYTKQLETIYSDVC